MCRHRVAQLILKLQSHKAKIKILAILHSLLEALEYNLLLDLFICFWQSLFFVAVGHMFLTVSKYILASTNFKAKLGVSRSSRLLLSVILPTASSSVSSHLLLCHSYRLFFLPLLWLLWDPLDGPGWLLCLQLSWLVPIMQSTEFLHKRACLHCLNG